MDPISKEEKKKKAYRRRDRFWKLVFPHYKSNNSHHNKLKNSNAKDDPKRTSDQDNKITLLSNYAKNNFSVVLDHELFASILENNEWDYKKSLSDLNDYEEASHGILVEPPKSSEKHLLGSENDGGTSCYIDALLFSMFISNTAFDPLLTYDIPPEQDTKIKLQTLMRLFVNKLRKGHFVNADYVHWFRKVLQEAGWQGQNESGNWAQEDSSELFMFITEMFDLPYLPFQIRLFHGANKDSDDDRVMTDRTLTLSVPDDAAEAKLQDILVDYFYNNIITGVKRQVDYYDYNEDDNVTENVAESPFMQNVMNDQLQQEKDEKYNLKKLLRRANSQKSDRKDEQAVTAWQVLELLPFYSASNEQGEAIQTQMDSSFPDTHMILPIVLKRYRYNSSGGSVKIKTHVDIPATIDFNKFVNQNIDDPLCPTCGHEINWTLHFKSAVCHRGDSPYSGHYISYARVMHEEVDEDSRHEEDPSFYWLKLDDMNTSSRVTQIKDSAASSIFEDLSENAYIIFYELDKTCHHRLGPSPISSASSINSGSIDVREELKSAESYSTYETDTEEQHCNCDKSKAKHKSSKTLSSSHHHHHHHHHNRHHLKESCRLM